MEETEVSGDNHQPVPSYPQTLSDNAVTSMPRHQRESTSQL